MVITCCVVGCKTRFSLLIDGVSFHKFPPNEALKQKWIVASGLPVSKDTKHLRICSKHFVANCFKKSKKGKHLLRNSIPTLNVNATPTVLVDVKTQGDDGNSDMEEIDETNSEMACNSSEIVTDSVKTKKNTKRNKLDEDAESDNVNSDMERIDEANSETAYDLSEIETDAVEMEIKPSKSLILKGHDKLPLETRKLIFKLQRKVQMAESQKKTIARLRAKVFRLRKRNEELTAAIEIMKNESLKDHRGPSILLVGM